MCIIWFLWLGSAALYGSVSAGAVLDSQCPGKRSFNSSTIGNVRQLYIGIAMNFTMDKNEQLRCSLQLNEPMPLLFKISSHSQLVRWIYFNETSNITNNIKSHKDNIVVPCAIKGRYDLILTAKKRSAVYIDIQGRHPFWNWKFLNESNPIRVRFQNRMQKKQMIVKWSKSKLDINAMHYCLVVNTKKPQKNFCRALQDSQNSKKFRTNKYYCISPIYKMWSKQRERIIDSTATNVICTGSKSSQILKGLVPNLKYFIDIYGVHTQKLNLTFLLKSTIVWFNRTHPEMLRDNSLTMGKIGGLKRQREVVFSYKIPHSTKVRGQVRFLILPCSGSQIDVKILKQKQRMKKEVDIYKPTYITMPDANPGDRLILRVSPSNIDEVIHANRVGLAVSMYGQFKTFPELPSNTSIFMSGSYRNCEPKIAWYPSQDSRRVRYCIIIFRIPNNNRSSIDPTNYCLDFGMNVIDHPQFCERNCYAANKGAQIEQATLHNLIAGDTYLVYVTVHLIGHNYLPYGSLKVNISKHCQNASDDILVKNISYYDN